MILEFLDVDSPLHGIVLMGDAVVQELSDDLGFVLVSLKGKQARAICVEPVLLVADFPEDLVNREKEGWLEVLVRGYRTIGGIEGPGDARTYPIEQAGGFWPSEQDERRRGDLAVSG